MKKMNNDSDTMGLISVERECMVWLVTSEGKTNTGIRDWSMTSFWQAINSLVPGRFEYNFE